MPSDTQTPDPDLVLTQRSSVSVIVCRRYGREGKSGDRMCLPRFIITEKMKINKDDDSSQIRIPPVASTHYHVRSTSFGRTEPLPRCGRWVLNSGTSGLSPWTISDTYNVLVPLVSASHSDKHFGQESSCRERGQLFSATLG